MQGTLDGEIADRSRKIADVTESMKTITSNLQTEARERAAGDDQCAKLVINAREQIEAETKERKRVDAELEANTEELRSNVDQEASERERQDMALKVQVTKANQDLVAERDERVAGEIASKRALQTLDTAMNQQFKDIRHTVEAEVEEREGGGDRMMKLCVENRALIEAERNARETALKEIEMLQKGTRLAMDQERHGRTSSEETMTELIIEVRNLIQQYKRETCEQIDEEHDEIDQLRQFLQKLESKINVDVSDVRATFDNEILVHRNSIEKLDKRLVELRGAVLVAVRGGGHAVKGLA